MGQPDNEAGDDLAAAAQRGGHRAVPARGDSGVSSPVDLFAHSGNGGHNATNESRAALPEIGALEMLSREEMQLLPSERRLLSENEVARAQLEEVEVGTSTGGTAVEPHPTRRGTTLARGTC